jgi:lincosamide nucleotidyltransferase A/C/D/E
MEAHHLVELVDLLERHGITVWLDGGWGVDALAGRQTRPHDDLDLVVELAQVPALRKVLAERGYVLMGGGPPMSFELVDADGRQVDVHPVKFDARGDGVYRMRTGEDWAYPAAGFAGEGSVLGRGVQCLSPEVQILCHAGYEFDDDDRHDLRVLHEYLGAGPGA